MIERKPECRRLNLQGILPCEHQRLVKYPLLLESLAKQSCDKKLTADKKMSLSAPTAESATADSKECDSDYNGGEAGVVLRYNFILSSQSENMFVRKFFSKILFF